MQTPHDRFFRHVFANPEHAAGELRTVLRGALAARIDWASVRLLPTTFVDPDLAEKRTDLLFSASLAGHEVFIYLLVEHQSSPDAFLPLRLLAYMVRIWEDYRRRHPDEKRLPPIVPIVVQHTFDGRVQPVAFEELLAVPGDLLDVLRPHLPCFSFVLDDLSQARDDELRARAMSALGRLALWCLKHARGGDDLSDELERWAEVLLEIVHAPDGVTALATVLGYLLEVSNTPPERLRALTHRLGPKIEEAFMTGGQRLIEEGRLQGKAEGLREGEAKGKAEGLREGLREGEAKGKAEGLRAAVLDLCELLNVKVGPKRRTQLEAMGVGELETLRLALKQTRRWPSLGRSAERGREAWASTRGPADAAVGRPPWLSKTRARGRGNARWGSSAPGQSGCSFGRPPRPRGAW
jgi:predicted transposase/invertase (TIGR01784 family)